MSNARWARPLCAGVAVSSRSGSLGTVGAIYVRAGTPCIVGTSHVTGKSGDTVWQPAPCGKPDCTCNCVGAVVASKREIVMLGGHRYYVDCAAAAIEPDVPVEPTRGGTTRAVRGMRVRKLGAVSGYTEGIVHDEHHVEHVVLETGHIAAPNQILIRGVGGIPFSTIGDSGALVTDEHGRAVGLLWGASASGEAVACHIEPVFHALGLEAP
jgi:hypothetical protein